MQLPMPNGDRRFFVTPRLLAALDDRQRAAAGRVFAAYSREIWRRGSVEGGSPELDRYRRRLGG